MVTILNEVLNADGMKVRIFCGGKVTTGLRLSGTWAGTAYIRASADGVNFRPASATPFASGTVVSSATANGNWFIPVGSDVAHEVEFDRTSGSLTVTLATADDASWQDAFLTAANLFVNSESTGKNTLTKALQANRAWGVESLMVSLAGPPPAGGTVYIAVYDGSEASGTLLFKQFLTASAVAGSVGQSYVIDLPEGGIFNTPGNAMTIVLFGPSAGVTSEINAKFTAR